MFEDRPILQKILIGAGAFSFVFAAAMGGTAFMISGGFGGDSEQPHTSSMQQPAQLVSEVQDTWSDWAAPPTDARTMPTSLSDQVPDEPWVEPAPPPANADLAGEASQARSPAVETIPATTVTADALPEADPVEGSDADVVFDDGGADPSGDKGDEDSGF